jgi:hypothetical protein
MSWRVFAGLFFMYILIVLLSGIMSETYMSSNDTTIFGLILRPQTPSYTNPVGGISSTFSVTADYISAFFRALFLDFPIFSGEYAIVRILILCVVAGVIAVQVISGIRPA